MTLALVPRVSERRHNGWAVQTRSIVLMMLTGGESSVGTLIRRTARITKGKVQIKDVTTYNALQELIDEGLVTWRAFSPGAHARRLYKLTQAGYWASDDVRDVLLRLIG